MYAVQDTQKSADWLFRAITENGILTVMAGLCIIFVIAALVSFTKGWIVTGTAHQTIVQQLNAANAIMQAQEESRTEKVERRLEALEDSVRDVHVKVDNAIGGISRIEARGGGRNAVG